jgi:putative FmdB family regulatory protein
LPTYEYACPRGHRFERFVRKISDAESSPACPECGEPAMRLISQAGLVFKGSGFYITDYGKDGKKKQEAPAAKSDGAGTEGAKSSDKGESSTPAPAAPAPVAPKTESKPAPKPKGGE